jgi:hypothetical protein
MITAARTSMPGNARGATLLLWVLVLALILGSTSVALYEYVKMETSTVDYREVESAARYMADGATEMAERQINRAIAGRFDVPTSGAVTLSHQGKPVTINYTIQQAGQTVLDTDPVGIVTLHQPFLIRSTISLPVAKQQSVTVTVNKIVDASQTPIFQFIAFYNQDMEIFPGPAMNLTGRVHSNQDIYIGSDNSLTINSNYIHSVGDMFRYRKDDNSLPAGTVSIQKKDLPGNFAWMDTRTQLNTVDGMPTAAAAMFAGLDSNFTGYDKNKNGIFTDAGDLQAWTGEAIKRWNGTVQTSVHGTQRLEAPTVGSITPVEQMPVPGTGTCNADGSPNPQGNYRPGFFYSQAGLRIKSTATATTAYDASGTDITAKLPLNTLTAKTFYDGREQKNVTVTEVDMTKLGTTTYYPPNGLLYAYRTDAVSTQPNGIRLVNGATLKAPLTVVSPDPVYIKGDYNVNTKQPAAVIADAVNLLSNAWADKLKSGSTAPAMGTATATTYNTAMITGNYVTNTNGKGYNGGFENLPRFKENWSGIKCTIRGSFVNLWLSQIAQGAWGGTGAYYNPPTRDWNFDNDFNTFGKLPPFTPMVVGTSKVVWWVQ